MQTRSRDPLGDNTGAHRHGRKVVGVGAWGALRRGVSQGRTVLRPRWDCGCVVIYTCGACCGATGIGAAAMEARRSFCGVVRSAPRWQSKGARAFRNASTPPSASTSFSRKWPYVGVSTSVVGSPSSPTGTRRTVRGALRKVVEA